MTVGPRPYRLPMTPRVLVLDPADDQRLVGWCPDDEAAEREAFGYMAVARRHGFSEVTALWHDGRDGRDWFALTRPVRVPAARRA